MLSSGMWHCVALVRTDILEECVIPVIRVTRISELGMLTVTSNKSTLQRNTIIKFRWPGTLWSYLLAHLFGNWGLCQEKNHLALYRIHVVLLQLCIGIVLQDSSDLVAVWSTKHHSGISISLQHALVADHCNVAPSLQILVTLMIEVIFSSET
jgi:hypothetical protein